MADYISREAAIAFAEHAYFAWNLAMAAADGRKEINLVYKRQELCKAVASVFTDAPAADVEPVRHGRWIPIRESEMTGWNPEFAGRNPIGGYKCSECWKFAVFDCNDEYVLSDFCPQCGAKMDGGVDNETDTVDAVPVVRCRECKYSYEDISGRCCSHGPCADWVVLDDSFCGQGERRTDNENR